MIETCGVHKLANFYSGIPQSSRRSNGAFSLATSPVNTPSKARQLLRIPRQTRLAAPLWPAQTANMANPRQWQLLWEELRRPSRIDVVVPPRCASGRSGAGLGLLNPSIHLLD